MQSEPKEKQEKAKGKLQAIFNAHFITGAQPKAGNGHKMQRVSVFS